MDVKQSLLNLSAAKLRKATALKERIEALHTELQNLIIEAVPKPLGNVMRKRRAMSAAARARMREAAKARWAKIRSGKKS